jgi:outer membrane protein assembly factor BamB
VIATISTILIVPITVMGQEKNAAGDWPTFGGSPSRNMANLTSKTAPTDWQVANQKNIAWVADLGTESVGGPPVIAGGRVFVGTNNNKPRDPKVKGEKAVLMCFAEKDGKFLWQAVHDMPVAPVVHEAMKFGQCGPPTVDGKFLYYVTPAAVLVCADVETGKAKWQLDMATKFKVRPNRVSSCAPLVIGDLVYVVTGNGTDGDSGNLPEPDAPSFLAANKTDGTVKWQSNLPGKNIIEGSWGNPAYAKVNDKGQVIFPGGDCWLYGMEPTNGKLLWKFHCNPVKEEKAARKRGVPNYLIATPVVHKDKVYVGVGLFPQNSAGNKIGHFWCVDLVRATENGKKNKDNDVSPKNDNVDPKAMENKTSALAWHYGGEIMPRPKFGRSSYFGRTFATAAIAEDLVYITEEMGYLHCLDAATGKAYWVHDFKTGVSTSPYWAAGMVYVGTDDSEMLIFAHGKADKVLKTIDMEAQMQGAAVVVNGTLYYMTNTKLFAIREKK